MKVFAVRSGYKVHCRKNNLRNDIYNPFEMIKKSLGIYKEIVFQEVFNVEFPPGTDVSNLSQREILDAILKSIDKK